MLSKLPFFGLLDHLFTRYDRSFIVLLGMQYFNQGAKTLVHLANTQNFKEHYKMEPSDMQYYSSFVYIPWTIKILYGLVSDNFPIFGSHRRSYIILGALMQMVFMTLMAVNGLEQFD